MYCDTTTRFLFRFDDWAHLELGVLLPPEARLFKQVAMYVCGYADQSSDVTLVIHGKKTVFRADVATTYTCESLGKYERQNISNLPFRKFTRTETVLQNFAE
jgi:hypothetical protein